jgi:hypothetical protein
MASTSSPCCHTPSIRIVPLSVTGRLAPYADVEIVADEVTAILAAGAQPARDR